MKQYYTVEEAAELLDVTDRTIWNYLRNGKLSSVAVKGHRRRKGKPGRRKTRIETASLLRCKMKASGVYGIRDMIVSHMERFEKDRFNFKEGCREMGIPEFDVDLSNWDEAEAGKALDDMEERLDPLMSYEEVAAFMETTKDAVKKYVQRGKLKIKKTNPKTGENLFSMVEVSELYRKMHGVTFQGSDNEDSKIIQEAYEYLKENPKLLEHIRNILNN